MSADVERKRDQTANARKVKARKYEERLAAILRERGWVCEPPTE